ncbi:MAG: Ppx/GppA family phosphatase [Actinobacteria bacterium]|nr:Ppx/GppA family phosphatase [Actinomycetota bacterium]
MKLGVLDVGSNTINLQMIDAHHGAPPTATSGYKIDLRLTEYLDDENQISKEGLKLLIRSIKQALKETGANSADELLAFATSAIREASNSVEVLEAVNRETSVELQVLSGIEEARFTFLAARRWFGWSAGDLLVIDIGGGSLEIARGTDEEPTYMNSLMLGASRLTREYLRNDPYSQSSVAELTSHIKLELLPFYSLKHTSGAKNGVGTSKTLRTLAKIAKSYSPGHGNNLTVAALEEIVPKIASMTDDERKSLPGISPVRAPQILAGGIVALEAMKALGLSELQICPWALREGIVLQRLDWINR